MNKIKEVLGAFAKEVYQVIKNYEGKWVGNVSYVFPDEEKTKKAKEEIEALGYEVLDHGADYNKGHKYYETSFRVWPYPKKEEMKEEQKLREVIRRELKEIYDLGLYDPDLVDNKEEILDLISLGIKNSSIYHDKNKLKPEETIYNHITEDYNIIKKGLKEAPDPEFLDKVEDNISSDIVDLISETLLNLGDIQKKLLKFRPKLVDEVAKATGILEGVQNKLSDGDPIGEGKDENTAGYKTLKKELQDLIKQRNEVNNQLDKIVKDGGKIVLSDPLYIKSKALTAKINKLNPKGIKVNLKEVVKSILKKKKATSAEYKKMKTMKGFKASDWKWEPKEHIYIKK